MSKVIYPKYYKKYAYVRNEFCVLFCLPEVKIDFFLTNVNFNQLFSADVQAMYRNSNFAFVLLMKKQHSIVGP